MDSTRILSILASILLLPILPGFISTISTLTAFLGVLQSVSATGEGDPKLFAGFLATHFTLQLVSIIYLIPGLIFCSVAVLKSNNAILWFKKVLTIYAWLLVLSLPILTVLGFYLMWLKRKILTT